MAAAASQLVELPIDSGDDFTISREDDSDVVLPSLKSMCQDSSSKNSGRDVNYEVTEVVWAKYRSCPYWPAVVKAVDKSNKFLKVLWLPPTFDQDLANGLKVDVKYIQKFGCKRSNYNRNMEDGRRHKKYGPELFEEAVRSAYDVINTRAEHRRIHQFPSICGMEFGEDPPVRDLSAVPSCSKKSCSKDFPNLKHEHVAFEKSDNEDVDVDVVPKLLSTTSPSSSQSAKEMSSYAKNERLIKFITGHKTVLNHLLKVAHRKTKSIWHNRWTQGTVQGTQDARVAPIVDHDQVSRLFNWLYTELLSQQKSTPKGKLPSSSSGRSVDYVLCVWMPEAICFALQKVGRFSKSRAVQIVDTPLDSAAAIYSSKPSLLSKPWARKDLLEEAVFGSEVFSIMKETGI